MRELAPDIALLDISMPGNGLRAAADILQSAGQTRIIVLTSSEDESEVMKALELGAAAYALKGVGGDDLVAVIRTVAAGGSYVAPTLAGRLLLKAKNRRDSPTAQSFETLSARERDVARLLTDRSRATRKSPRRWGCRKRRSSIT